MGLNISALKAKLNQFTKQGDRNESIWKPTEGKTVIRIVPYKENRENPFIELNFHYLGNKTYLSPTSYGNRDPILEFAEELASTGGKDGWMQSRAFRPKLRTHVPIIVRGEEEKGVRFWAFGKTVYTELLSLIDDPDYGDITDVKSGHDLVIEYIPQEKSDTNFAKTMVRAKPSKTPLAASAEQVQKFLTDQPDIRALFKEPTFQELKVALSRYLNPDEDGPTAVNDEEVTSSPTAARSAEVKNSTSVKDMIDEFDEVFN
jgi:hypothetical protein